MLRCSSLLLGVVATCVLVAPARAQCGPRGKISHCWGTTKCPTLVNGKPSCEEKLCDCPADSATGVECSGHGTCDKSRCSQREGARCRCEQDWYGGACGKSRDSIIDDMQDRDKWLNSTKQDKDRYRDKKKECRSQGRGLIPCPGGKDDEVRCEERVLDCFESNNTKPDLKKCDRGEKYCLVLGACISKDAKMLCPPIAGKCPEQRPVRCHDWKCVRHRRECGSGKPGGNRTADGSAYCPDGSLGRSIKDCARNMTWEGCPGGKVECPQRRGKCADSLQECERVTGCPNGTMACGMQRDDEGRPIREVIPGTNKTRAAYICKHKCKWSGREDKVVAVTRALEEVEGGGRRAKKLDVMSEGGRVALRIAMTSDKAFRRIDNRTGEVAFDVRPVPDSHWQEGSFKRFEDEGSLMGLVTVEPTVPIELDEQGGLELLFPVLDDAALDVDRAMCSRLVSQVLVLSVDDIAMLDQEPEYVGHCRPALMGEEGGRGNCSCSVNVSHFTTFATVEMLGAVMLARLPIPRL